VPSFKQRDRAKRVEPVESKRVVSNERSALIDRVLQALEKPAAAQEAAPSIQPASRETAAQAAARIAEPEPAPTGRDPGRWRTRQHDRQSAAAA
jgi:hypothetical protein